MRRAAIILVIFVVACGGSVADRASQTLQTALSATNSARDELVRWDKQHQLAIVDSSSSREEAESSLRTYRAKRQKIVRSFAVAYSSIATAAALVPLVEAGEASERDLAKLLLGAVEAVTTAAHAYRDISDAFSSDGLGPDRPPNPEGHAPVESEEVP